MELDAEFIDEIGILTNSPTSLFAKPIPRVFPAISVPIISITVLCLSPCGDDKDSFLLPVRGE